MSSSIESHFLAVGLIHREEAGTTEYLVVQKGGTGHWTPVSGLRLEKETFRETIIREIAWLLRLEPSRDFIVSNMSAVSREFIEEGGDGVRHRAIAFYRARIYSKQARLQIAEDPNCRWITSEELCHGRTKEGLLLDEELVKFINDWQVVRPWR